jgi:hypothetical protein
MKPNASSAAAYPLDVWGCGTGNGVDRKASGIGIGGRLLSAACLQASVTFAAVGSCAAQAQECVAYIRSSL